MRELVSLRLGGGGEQGEGISSWWGNVLPEPLQLNLWGGDK